MLEKLKNYLQQFDRFAKNNAMVIDELKEGFAKTSMVVKNFHLNGANVAHGGAIFTLADFAFAIASNSYGRIALSINSSISFLNSAKEGERLIATATEVDKNHKLGTYEVKVKNEKDVVIATFLGTVYRKSQTLEL